MKFLEKIYTTIIIVTGITLPIFFLITKRPLFPSLLYYSLLITSAVISAFLYITIGNTIVSFEIVIYYFLLLSYGPEIGATTAVFTILVVWIAKAIFRLKKEQDKKRFFHTLKMGMYNAGTYGLIFFTGGKLIQSLKGIKGALLGSVIIVSLNEIIFSLHVIIQKKNYLNYLKREGIKSNLLELLIYPFGISMAFLYKNFGPSFTLPLIISLLLLSYIGWRMSEYERKLVKRVNDVTKLNETARILSSTLDLGSLVKIILQKMHDFIKTDKTCICVKIPEENIKILKEYDGKEFKNNKNLQNYEKIPLTTGNSNIGFIGIKTQKPLSEGERIILENFAKHCAISLLNAVFYNLSITDPLTKLFTRRYFETKLKEKIKQSTLTHKPFALILFDIDNFKNINDNYGHKEGDKILIKFAKTLKKLTNKTDIVARWGGDEFVAILSDTKNIKSYIQKIKENIPEIPFTAEWIVYTPGEKIKSDELFHAVDKKLLKAKRR